MNCPQDYVCISGMRFGNTEPVCLKTMREREGHVVDDLRRANVSPIHKSYEEEANLEL